LHPEALPEPLESRAATSPAGEPRFAVLGNCQAQVFGRCLSALMPAAEVLSVQWADLAGQADAERLASRLEDYDAVISQSNKGAALPALQTRTLAQRVERLVIIPSIHFTGFHPDILWLPFPHWKGRGWPLSSYHSLVAMAGFALELPQERTVELFNAFIYANLGYFDEYAKAEQHHSMVGRAMGFDLEGLMAPGGLARPFMHAPNHPGIGLLFELARQVCARLGLRTRDGPSPPDLFAGATVWPVYPEIARRLGCEGSLVFRPGHGARDLTLEELVDRTYRLLAVMPAPDLPRLNEACRILKGLGL
jgi:hypothetical protein